MNFRKFLPYVEIIEQPTKTLRFRYECEGRLAGNIPGASSTLENKTCPSIRVVGYKGQAIAVASCVTKDKPYRPHPHNLIGREGCEKGVCTIEITSEDMTVTFANLGIMCVKRNDIKRELKIREEIRVDPFRTGFQFKRDLNSIDLNSVRLCFQVFLEGTQKGKFNVPLTPIVSDPIFDKKIIPDLMICELSHYSASVAGGMHMILLCEKVVKDDIQVRFFEEKNGKVVWEGFGDFHPAHVHKQTAIRFKTSSYHTQEIEEPVSVQIQLKRPSDGALSEPLPFLMLPLSPDNPNSLKRKKRKINNNDVNTELKQKETETEEKSSEVIVPRFECSENEELFPLRALEIISEQPQFNNETIREEISPIENNPTLIQSPRPSPQYPLTNGDAEQVSIDLRPKEQFSYIHDMLQIQPEEHLTLTKVTSESRYEEFHLLENAGEVEETNGINTINMDSLECDFDSNLLKINSEELYNFNIENLSENLSNILSISDIAKFHCLDSKFLRRKRISFGSIQYIKILDRRYLIIKLIKYKMKLCLCFLLQLFVLTMAQRTILDSPDIRSVVRLFRNLLFQTFGKEERVAIQYTNKLQKEIPPNIPFPCNLTGARSPTIPDSVHRLRPGDIDVIAALGDSLTSGMGIFATNLLDLYIENRGVMAIIGGEKNWRKYLTIPNILKEFNPNLIGYSLGDSLTTNPASQLNVAEIGAMSRDMPFMAKFLVNRIKNDERIDIEKHWKMIFILIGFNDICTDICVLPSPWSCLENHKKDLLKTLRILRDNLPRTFVGLIIPTHLREIVETDNSTNSIICYAMRAIFCSCLFSLRHKNQREEYFKIMSRWQEIDEEIAKYPEFHTNDFTVIPLPGIKNAKLPRNKDGLSEINKYFSADCFHISQLGNARSANTLWNNLLQPIGKKTNNEWLLPFEKFLCPTSERPYLATFENS